MKIIVSSCLSDTEKLAVFKMWNNEYPETLCYQSVRELEEFLAKLPEQYHFLLTDLDGKTKDWYFSFLRNKER